MFCLYGDEVIRQIGPNYQGLEDKLQKMVKLGEESDDDGVGIDQKWVPYGARFERYYAEVLRPLYQRNVSDF